MNDAQDPMLINQQDDQGNMVQVHKNWYICGALLLFFGCFDVWLLGKLGLTDWTSAVPLGNIYVLLFHGTIAVSWIFVLLLQYLDTTPMVARYRVPGKPYIPMVQRDFVHSGRWTTFTTWCNTLAACYFCLLTAASVSMLFGDTKELPELLTSVLGILWDIIFPMGFLVNLIVTFVLLPAKKKNKDFVGLWYMLRWRGQALHNGYVICVALEACIVSPKMPLKGFPVIVLYGCSYIVFSYMLFAKTRVFHYFFLDPRWKFAPLGLFGLCGLLASLFCAGSFAMKAEEHSQFAKLLVMIAALGTCTFRDAAAVAPSEYNGRSDA